MNHFWTAQKIAEATQGKLIGNTDWSTVAFAIDSRALKVGNVFIALEGEKVDGHDFVKQVIDKGAIAAVVHKKLPSYPSNFPLILVEKTDKALVNLGNYARKNFKGKVVGVTGSAGKTSTKDMLAFCLADQAKTHKSEKSFNTKLGVPLTIANCPPASEFLVLEIGMSLPGEISLLTHIAKPDVAIITTIAHAHIEFLKSLDGVAKAKAEIFEGLQPNGTAIVNGDLDQTHILVEKAKENNVKNIFLFGENPACQTRLLKYEPSSAGCHIRAEILGEEVSYKLQAFGKHHAMNSLAVLTALKMFKADLQKAIITIGNFTETEGRGKSYLLRDDILLVDESYNANPDSTRAALIAFQERPINGRRIVILGDMGELGPQSGLYHRNLKTTLQNMKIDFLFTYGPLMKELFQEAHQEIHAKHFDDLNELSEELTRIIKPKDELFIKSSKSTRLSLVAERIRKHYAV
ncbi:MAG: UDP-N-acetylmuramoyl-tripeptide--D-alanyl-D-alanine ligase [Alphaproteobacteria bacterium]